MTIMTINQEKICQWTSQSFLECASHWLSILRSEGGLETIRLDLLAYINIQQYTTYSGGDHANDLERVIVRDCARAWRGLLNPRSEDLAGFSVLRALIDVAKGTTREDLKPAFWGDICHLVMGLEGTSSFHGEQVTQGYHHLKGRDAALARSDELDLMEEVMENRMNSYEHGLSRDSIARRKKRKNHILKKLGGLQKDWKNWRWHVRHIARTSDDLSRMAYLTERERHDISLAREYNIPFGVTPYYASLFDEKPDEGRDRAVRAQVIPPESYSRMFHKEIENFEDLDFMKETDTSPVDLVTRRYAAIVILKPFNACPQVCVYCQRNWEIKGPMAPGALADMETLDAAIAWIRDRPAIKEILVTGGDPLVLTDKKLKEILDKVSSIDKIERIRIGSRIPVTLPMRITKALAELLSSYRIPGKREVCLVTHVEHPYEITPELVAAVERIRLKGISVYNQNVYTFFVSRRFEAAALRRLLRVSGIDPYYTFYPKGKQETDLYRVPIARLLQENKEEARLLPGLARTDEPVYNVPGLGKNHLNSWQHRDLISIRPDGSRVYEFHPWEKKIVPQHTYVGDDIPILEYLKRLTDIGEKMEDYRSIWYYF